MLILVAVFLIFFVSQAQVTVSPLSILNSCVVLSTQVKDGDAEGLLEGLGEGAKLIVGFELNVGGLLFVSVGGLLFVRVGDAVGAIVAFGPTGAIVAFGPTGAIVTFGPTGGVVELVSFLREDGDAVGAIVAFGPTGAIVTFGATGAVVELVSFLREDVEGAFVDWALAKASQFNARKTEEKKIDVFIIFFWMVQL